MCESSVQVGIRIRPFNDREKNLGAKLCVDMDGIKTILLPVVDGEEPRTFVFDASFWSHDGFENDDNGYSRALPGSKYSDQRVVFDKFGQSVLDNAWEGYHCCLFAYGQTGSGKSYSMVGYGANRGIVPVACEEIFNRIDKSKSAELEFEVTVSMIEIYNECVQDLLIKPKDRPKTGLHIRENKQLGIYVDGVRKRPVDSYASIERVTEEGTSNRTVGSTMMNATSSRAHTVIIIEFKQIQTVDGGKSEKLSMINLVDLAGSEKADQTGASGDRLKEGCAINKSLSALGNVIEKLADKASGKGKNVVIPYRDSKLTRLLQNALGGSSKTVMICAISPASSNHEETLGTLRYADRAKKIKNVAVINESAQDKMIRELKEENEKLKKLMGGELPAGMSSEEIAQKEAEISALQEALKNMEKSFAERVADSEKEMSAEAGRTGIGGVSGALRMTVPHLANLNEDMMLTNKLHFTFKEGATRIGKDPSSIPPHQRLDQAPDIILNGSGIYKDQATVWMKDGKVKLESKGVAASTTKVNGASPEGDGGAELLHGDRVAFGNTLFIFVDPGKGTVEELFSSGKVSYAMALKELGGKFGASDEEIAEAKKQAEVLANKAKEAQEAAQKAHEEAEAKLKKREEEFQAKLQAMKEEQEREDAEDEKEQQAEIEKLKKEFEEKNRLKQEEAQRRIEELEKLAKEAASDEAKKRKKMELDQLADEKISHVMPLVNEANFIASELGKPHRLEFKWHLGLGVAQEQLGATVAVSMDGLVLYEWSPATLENRVYLMRELLQQFDDEGPTVLEKLADEEDPFWDPVQIERQIGVAQVRLDSLLEQIENVDEFKIFNSAGQLSGSLHVEIWPVGKNGEPGIPDDEELVDDLLGTKMTLLLKVLKATDIPKGLSSNVRVEYDWFMQKEPIQVPAFAGSSCNPEFNYENRFVQDPVTSRFKDFLGSCLVLRVYGESLDAAEKASSKTPMKPPGARSSGDPHRAKYGSKGPTAGRLGDIERVRDTRTAVREELRCLWEQAGLPNETGLALGTEDREAVADLCMEALTQAEGERGEPLQEHEIIGLVIRVLCQAAATQARNGGRETAAKVAGA
mmetsp:Transcript_59294/g.94120  ORF Transcript_59294/g.94120 Transcript_59294/m.94120 type:complete len:1093 (+) Transcript_59294:45-3323(+)